MLNYISNLFKEKKQSNASVKVCNSFEEALHEIEEVGFAVIPLLDAATHDAFYKESVLFVDEVYEKHKTIDFFALGRSEFPAIRNASNAIVRKYIEQPLQQFIGTQPYEIIFGTHLLKANNDKSVLNPHQDSSHVDEFLYHTFHFWIPVSNPEPDFGTLEVIPYSHKLQIPYRSLNIPWALQEHEKNLWKFMKKIHVQKGQAILFNSALLHASGINTSDKMRIAANSLIKPVAADFIHCYTDEQSGYKNIELYKVTPEFYYNENIMERPNARYTLLKTTDNVNRQYSLKELRTIFKEQ